MLLELWIALHLNQIVPVIVSSQKLFWKNLKFCIEYSNTITKNTIYLAIREEFFFGLFAKGYVREIQRFINFWNSQNFQVAKVSDLKVRVHMIWNTVFFISIKLISILKLRCLENKHILSIFSSLRIFLIVSISSQIKCKE